MTKPVLNLDEVVIETPSADHAPKGTNAQQYDIRWGEIASRIGARKLGYNLTVVAPGKRNCPFHSHRVEEEMFFILEGTGELRYGDARHPLRAGDIIACPTGGHETAHQIINTGDVELRYLAVSNQSEAEICEYPDSGKYLAFAPGDASGKPLPRQVRVIGRPEDSLDYWDGE
ncbi:cupin domain-containing protein [Dyella psychrodurans]|uniref:Cupin domain-containing protein n=1 Tax=Dyella psychrodurans TaxID=1927960 RepID=A0A370XB21_9GAMM|nr:cupin domain-containing protein [Dyella psychrodurans]RDS85614.1 cupin domain-containing protein [Dyella psychrodurans]